VDVLSNESRDDAQVCRSLCRQILRTSILHDSIQCDNNFLTNLFLEPSDAHISLLLLRVYRPPAIDIHGLMTCDFDTTLPFAHTLYTSDNHSTTHMLPDLRSKTAKRILSVQFAYTPYFPHILQTLLSLRCAVELRVGLRFRLTCLLFIIFFLHKSNLGLLWVVWEGWIS
jgi:hypothetical protein